MTDAMLAADFGPAPLREEPDGTLDRAMQFRRDVAVRIAQELAERSPLPVRLFFAGCGRLRECDRIRGLPGGRVAKIVAFDLDAESLDGVRRDYPDLPVVAHHGSIRQLVDGKHLFDDMHFVHAGVLMELLPQDMARALTRALFAMLRPAGTLLVTNRLARKSGSTRFEARRDWRLACRTREEIEDLAGDLPDDVVAKRSYLESPDADLGVLVVERR
jgi:hypothetical protein